MVFGLGVEGLGEEAWVCGMQNFGRRVDCGLVFRVDIGYMGSMVTVMENQADGKIRFKTEPRMQQLLVRNECRSLNKSQYCTLISF